MIISKEQLPDGNIKEIYSDGREIVRGSDGRIIKTFLPPETASKMSVGFAVEDDITELLERRGFTDTEDVGLRALGATALSGKAGSTNAIRYLDQLASFNVPGGDNIQQINWIVPNMMCQIGGADFVRFTETMMPWVDDELKRGLEAKNGGKANDQ